MILQRLKTYIDAKGITIAAFEKSVGMSNASFSKSLKSGGAVGTDKLENILKVYPDISPIWLLTGEGEMLSHGRPSFTTTPSATTPDATLQALLDTIRQQAEQIGQLKERISQLENSHRD